MKRISFQEYGFPNSVVLEKSAFWYLIKAKISCFHIKINIHILIYKTK
jgi:hypothetical protein